jgi:peptidoglycan-N-acetylglucosamine deacetylase
MRGPRLLALALGLCLTLAAPFPAVAGADDDYSEIVRGDPASGVVALTFDAGAGAGPPARQILDLLRERRLRVTFFLSGHWVVANPDMTREIFEDGHELSNHSYYHADLVNLADNQVVWELDYTDHVVSELVGVHTRPFFRPPFGSRNSRVLNLAAASGFRSVFWTLDSGDWLPRATAGQVADKVLRFSEAGDIVVEHIASQASADALPVIIDGLAERGLRVGTVSEAMGRPRYDGRTRVPEAFDALADAERLLTQAEQDPAQARPAAVAALRSLLLEWSLTPRGDTVTVLLEQAAETDESLRQFRSEAAVLDRFEVAADAYVRAKIFVDAARARLANI